MKIVCYKDTLLKALNSVIKGVASKTTNPILEGILIIPLKLYIQDDNLWLEYYTKEEYEESNKDAEIYCDRMEDFSADEINATFIIIEKTENLNKL